MTTTKDFRGQTAPEVRDWRGMIRRMAIKLTDGSFWQALGHTLTDGKGKEIRHAEVFSGIGFYSRSAAGANSEAIVVFPGGASADPIIIATRDEDARKAIALLAQDETAMFNRATIIIIHDNGTVEIRSKNGTALKLPTMADFTALVSILNGAGTGSATAIPAAIAAYQSAHPTWPTGTAVLKAE